MRQLKIIQSEPDVKTGIVTANFAMPIRIEGGSVMALDKFNCTLIKDAEIVLPDQTIEITTQTDADSISVFIAGRSYASIVELFNVLNQLINQAWTGTFGAYTSDQGLAFLISKTGANFCTLAFRTVSPTNLIQTDQLTLDSCSLKTDLIITQDGEVGVWDAECLLPLLKGGGVNVGYAFRPDKLNGTYQITTGIRQTVSNDTFYLNQEFSEGDDTFGVITLESSFPPGAEPIVIPDEVFYPDETPTTRYVVMIQNIGSYVLQIWTANEDLSKGGDLLYESVNNGDWTWNANTVFQVIGLRPDDLPPYEVADENPGFGGLMSVTLDGTVPTEETPTHTFIMDFTLAETLRKGLNLDTIVTLGTNVSFGSITTTEAISFDEDFRGVSIEVMDIPLESYEAGGPTYPPSRIPTAGLRQPGARKNVLAYFLPVKSGPVNERIYDFFQSEYQWLTLANKEPFEISSFNFKIYETATGKPLNTLNYSFNVLIKDKE